MSSPDSTKRRGTPSFGLAGAAGILLLVGGCGAGIVAYDKKYFPGGPLEQQAIARGESSGPSPVWDVVSGVGTLAVVAGVLLILGSIVGAVVAGLGRAARQR